MHIKLKEGNMFYNVYNEGKPILFLHGWGQNSATFNDIIKHFFNYKVVIVDFLGFGQSDVPNRPLYLNDYVSHIEELLEYLRIDEPIIIGHSFGGRVAIRYCTKGSLYEKLILIDSAGIKPKRTVKYYLKIYSYKVKKRFYYVFSKNKYRYLIESSGSSDFKSAVPIMKKTLINVINEDLKKELKNIKNPTLLLWGVNDQATPYSDALIMNQIIKDCKLIPFYSSGHFSYLDEKKKAIKSIKDFIESSGGIVNDSI